MPKRKLTPGYVLFYILFSPDTWRLLIGILLAWFLVPLILQSNELSRSGQIMVWIMVITIGWAVSAFPGRKIAGFFKRAVLKDKV